MERRQARSGSPYEGMMGFSRAVRVGSTITVSGTAPIWPDGHVDPDPTVQARRCWDIVVAALDELGASVADVVRTRQYVVRAEIAEPVGAVHGEVFGDVRPASTMVVVAGLLDARWVVEVEADAVVAESIVPAAGSAQAAATTTTGNPTSTRHRGAGGAVDR
jgi:enamine deaminase RidA (YjgF/YER057c/UK114 family)